MGRSQGFTLIEILLTISIAAIIMIVTVTSYRGFQDRQQLTQAVQTFKTNLRLAQNQAFSGVKPLNGCTILRGWYVQINNPYPIGYICQQDPNTPLVVTAVPDDKHPSVKLPQDISIAPANQYIIFQTINKDAVFATSSDLSNNFPPASTDTLTITLSDTSGNSQTIVVSKTGDVQ